MPVHGRECQGATCRIDEGRRHNAQLLAEPERHVERLCMGGSVREQHAE